MIITGECSIQREVSRARKSENVKFKKEREEQGTDVGDKSSAGSHRSGLGYLLVAKILAKNLNLFQNSFPIKFTDW